MTPQSKFDFKDGELWFMLNNKLVKRFIYQISHGGGHPTTYTMVHTRYFFECPVPPSVNEDELFRTKKELLKHLSECSDS